MQRPPAKTDRRHLRLARPNEIDEDLAVETARMHAVNRSRTWRQYLQNLEFSLCLELDFDSVVGLTALPERGR